MVLEDCGKFDFQASQQHSDTYGWHALRLGQPLGNEQQTLKSTVNDRTTEKWREKNYIYMEQHQKNTNTFYWSGKTLRNLIFGYLPFRKSNLFRISDERRRKKSCHFIQLLERSVSMYRQNLCHFDQIKSKWVWI